MPRVIVPIDEQQPVKATLTTALSGTHNDLTYTAIAGGPGGNSIRVSYVVGAGTNLLTVVVEGFDITVNVATTAGASTSTATQVLAALIQRADVTAMVTPALASGNDGTGIVTALAFTNLTGGALGVLVPAVTNGDSVNGHYFTGNDGKVILEVVSTDGSSRTVSVNYSPTLAPGVAVAAAVETIAAGTTKILGPFDPRQFNQNTSKDVYFTPSVSNTIDFRARRVTPQG